MTLSMGLLSPIINWMSRLKQRKAFSDMQARDLLPTPKTPKPTKAQPSHVLNLSCQAFFSTKPSPSTISKVV